ncbi:hypothetical protein Tco_0364243 [Tanacetum coccineum]
MAKRAQPALYDADTLLHLTHQPVSIWDSEEVLVQQVVSMKKMSEKPGHVRQTLNSEWLLLEAKRPYLLPNQNCIIKERTTQKPDYVSEWCFDYAKQFVEQQLVPFYDHFKKHIQAANDTFFKEIREFEQIFDDLETEYEQCVLDNKNLTIEKKNLLIKNDCLIAECLEKDICSIVFTSDSVVPPSSNCLCEDLRSALIIMSTYNLNFRIFKQCIDTTSAVQWQFFENNKLRQKLGQLQGREYTIRNLDAQINIMKVLKVGTTESSCDQQALETDRIQLKDTITSLRIQLDGLKVEHVRLKRRYDELSKANNHSHTVYTEKLSAFTAENTKLKAQVTGTTSSGPSTSETPKVLAPGMYNLGVKPTSGASKTVPKRAPRNHSSLPVKSANARRVEAHHRTLNKKNHVDSNLLVKHSVSVSNLNNVCGACNKSLVFANHSDCLVMCDGSVNVKPHQTKRFKPANPQERMETSQKVWNRFSKPVANSRCLVKPTTYDRDLAQSYHFVEKFIGTVRFGNDEYAAIICYGDYNWDSLVMDDLEVCLPTAIRVTTATIDKVESYSRFNNGPKSVLPSR